jgi:CheY-like chemotaxis protein
MTLSEEKYQTLQNRISNLEYIIAENPNDVNSLQQLATCYEATENVEELCNCYRRLGNIHRSNREYEIALRYYDRAILLCPPIAIPFLKQKLAIFLEKHQHMDAYLTAKEVIQNYVSKGDRESAINFLRMLPSLGTTNAELKRQLSDLIPGKEGKADLLLRSSWRSIPRFNPEFAKSGIIPTAGLVEPNAPKNENYFASLLSSAIFSPSMLKDGFLEIPKTELSTHQIMVIGRDEQWRSSIINELSALGCRLVEASSANEAQELMAAGYPSLIIAQLVANYWDWCQLFAQLQADENTFDIPFICLNSSKNPEDTVQALNLGVADCWNWPQPSDEFYARIKHVLQVKYDERNAIIGFLAEVSLPDALQMIEGCRKTGTFIVKRNSDHGEIYFDDGRPIDAQYLYWGGEAAFFRLAQWTEGTFRFHSHPVERKQKIRDTVQGLLMETMRRMDEQAKIIPQLPEASKVLCLNPGYKRTVPLSPALPRVMELINKQSTIAEFLTELDMDVEALEVLANFYQLEIFTTTENLKHM